MKIKEVYPWGSAWPPPSGAGNYHGQEGAGTCTKIEGYTDRHPFTAPAGSYAANLLGIFDLGGNVWEWVEDKWSPSSSSRVLRGASWSLDVPDLLLSSYRLDYDPSFRFNYLGFRCVVVDVGER